MAAQTPRNGDRMIIEKTEDNGTIIWRLNGITHRDDGPAIVWEDGAQSWYQHGQLHRVDGPAYIGPNGARYWYLNSVYHRTDGPAIEYADGEKFWFLFGVKYDPVTWMIKVHELGSK